MTSMEFAAAMGEIDEKLAYMHDSRNEKRRAVPLWRYAAAAAAILLVLGAVFAAVKLLPANAPKQEAVLPPAREGKEGIAHSTYAITLAAAEAHGGIIKLPSVEIPEDAVLPPAREGEGTELACGFPGFDYSTHGDAYINADAVYVLTVLDWLNEGKVAGLGYTIYEARVDYVLKGPAAETIKLFELVSSEMKFGLLYTYGDRLLIPLIRDDSGTYGYDVIYAPAANDYSIFDVETASDGRSFVMDDFVWGEELSAHIRNYRGDADIASELIAKLYARDPYRAEREKDDPQPFPYIFSLDELVEYFRGLE